MADSALTERKRDYSRLTRAELGSLIALARAGKTQTEIAQALNCNISTVSRWLAQFEDTTELAKQRLKNSANTLAERVVKDADVEQSLEVLDRLEVLPKRQNDSNRTGVQIFVGMPSSPIGPDPVIQVNEIPYYQTQTDSESKTSQ